MDLGKRPAKVIKEMVDYESPDMIGTANRISKAVEKVHSPSHYNQGKYETIEVIKDITNKLPGYQGYLVGNMIKYLSRYPYKNGIEDVEKAKKHIAMLLDELKEEENNA